MQINLFNAKNPNGKRVPVTLTLEQIDITNTNDGELVYIASLSTGARKPDGTRIDTVYVNTLTEEDFKKEVQKELTFIASQIDWGVLESDVYQPMIIDMTPRNNEQVDINRDVFIQLKDPFPASFIDLNTLKLSVNDVDVTSEVQVSEKENQITLQWTPRRVF